MPKTNHAEQIVSALVEEDASLADLVAEFVSGLNDRIQAMDSALQSGCLTELRSLAHQLKGAGGGYGFPILTETAAELEKRALHEQLDRCAKSLDELKTLVSRVVAKPGR